MDPDTDPKGEKVIQLLEAGWELVGSLAGAAVALKLQGSDGVLMGAAAGSAATSALKRVGAEIHDRFLSPLERSRIGAVGLYTLARIRQNIEDGKVPRQDGFFEAKGNKRPKAEELLEGVMLKAKDAYEQGKLPYLGNLYANLAFGEGVTAEEANLFLKYMDDITYRELVLLALVGKRTYSLLDGRDDFNLRVIDYHNIGLTFTQFGILHEFYDLIQKQLIFQRDERGERVFFMAIGYIIPARLALGQLGVVMYQLMRLSDISNDEIEELAVQHLR